MYSTSVYVENVCLHGGAAPALPGVLSVRALRSQLLTGARSPQQTCPSLRSLQSVSHVLCSWSRNIWSRNIQLQLLDGAAPCTSLSAELTLATPGVMTSATVSTTVFLATSFVEARAAERRFIRLELLTADVDKHFAPGHNVHFTCTFLSSTSRTIKCLCCHF